MQQDTIECEDRNRQRIISSAEAEAHSHQTARDAAASVPSRRNKPSTSTPKQQKKRLRQAYAAYSHLPKELQDNEYITTGYRGEMGFLDSVKSLFGLHNETGNIWTHLIGILSDSYPVGKHSKGPYTMHGRVIHMSFVCRLHALPYSYNCHCLCQASPTGSRIPTACRS